MAFLLLVYEKMRLQRKVNKLTLRQTQLSSRKERIAKNIEKVQKMYSSKITNAEKQAQLWASQAKNNIFNSMGLGMQNQMFNPMGGYSGITSFVAGRIGQLLAGGVPVGEKGSDGKAALVQFGEGDYNKLMQEYCSGTLKEYTEDGKVIEGKYGSNGDITEQQYKAFMMSLSMAQSNQQQAQFMAQQMSSQYESNVSVWTEAYKAQLEEEQNAALLPLEAEETDIDLDMSSCEVQLADAKARLDSIKQACSEEIKNSAPTFGLG